jgi:hypothetical protein
MVEDSPDTTTPLDEWLLSCRCESARAVTNLLTCLESVAVVSSGGTAETGASQRADSCTQSQPRRSLSRKKTAMQPVTVFCSPTCLTFHVYGKAKQTQASVDIPSTLFSEYRVTSQQQQQQSGDADTKADDWQAGGEFCVNLATVLECLQVLGSSNGAAGAVAEKTQLAISYNLTQEIFKLELLNESVLCCIAIPGMQLPEDDLGNSLALAFRSSPMVARLIVQSDSLLQVLSELDFVTGAVVGTVSLGVEGLSLAAVGHWGQCQVSIPAVGGHVVSSEVPDNKGPHLANYQLHALLAGFKGLDIAQETCLTMNSAGMMAIQHQVVDAIVGDGSPCFVDHILCCLADDDDETDEQDEEGEAVHDHLRDDSQTHLLTATQHSSQGTRRRRPTETRVGILTTGTQESDDSGVVDISQRRPASGRMNRVASSTQSSSSRPTCCCALSTKDSSDDDSDNDVSFKHASSRLFGQVPLQSTGSSDSSIDRSVRPRTTNPVSRHQQRYPAQRDSASRRRHHPDSEEGDDHSVNLLEDQGFNQDNDGEGEESQPELDVAAPVSPRPGHRSRDDECSSPELVYGKQNK